MSEPFSDSTKAAPAPRPATPAEPGPGGPQRDDAEPGSAEPNGKGVLRRDRVRLMTQPVLVDGHGGEHGQSLTVVPLMDGDRIAGLEVRCGCGASTLIECIYEPEASS